MTLFNDYVTARKRFRNAPSPEAVFILGTLALYLVLAYLFSAEIFRPTNSVGVDAFITTMAPVFLLSIVYLWLVIRYNPSLERRRDETLALWAESLGIKDPDSLSAVGDQATQTYFFTDEVGENLQRYRLELINGESDLYRNVKSEWEPVKQRPSGASDASVNYDDPN